MVSKHKDMVIDLNGVTFSWPTGETRHGDDGFVLEIPSFSVRRGEKILLTGPSGSGKSTLLGLLCGTLQARAGTIEICGTQVDQLRTGARDMFRADHLGVIFQLFNLVPYLSVLENVLLPLHFSAVRRARVGDVAAQHEQARILLAQLGLDDTVLDRPVTALSVGQQQRVAAARALIGSPDIVIADEPTSSLDAARQSDFLALLFARLEASGGTLLMVSHDERLAGQFDRMVRLEDILVAGPAVAKELVS